MFGNGPTECWTAVCLGKVEHKVEYPSQDRLRERVSLGTSMELLLVNLMKSYDVSEAYPTVGPDNNGPMIRNDQALRMRQTWAASTWVGFKTCVPWSILRHMGNGHPFHILGTFNGWMKIGPGAGSNLAQANAFHSTEHLHNTLADAGLYPLGGIQTSIHSST